MTCFSNLYKGLLVYDYDEVCLLKKLFFMPVFLKKVLKTIIFYKGFY